MNTITPPPTTQTGARSRSTETVSHPTDRQRMTQALARIESSRGALIRCLKPEQPKARRASADRLGEPMDSRSFAESLAARIGRNGLLQGSWRTLRALSRRWWTRQPWHSSVDLVGQTLVHQAQPMIRRHPMASLAVAAALGAGLTVALSAARPWASQQMQRQAGPWKDRLGGLLWAQLTATPVQMALAGALTAWLADRANTGARSTPESPGAPRPNTVATAAPNGSASSSASG